MTNASKIKVLIAEDDPQVRQLYTRILKEYETIFVTEGSEGLKAIEAGWKPDIILSDYDMGIGYMNGVQFCERLRALGNRTPFILISGNDYVKELAEKCGASWGLSKPAMKFQIDELVKRLVPSRPPTPCAVQVVSSEELAEAFAEKVEVQREFARDEQALAELEKK